MDLRREDAACQINGRFGSLSGPTRVDEDRFEAPLAETNPQQGANPQWRDRRNKNPAGLAPPTGKIANWPLQFVRRTLR